MGGGNSPLCRDAITRRDLCVSTEGVSGGHVTSTLLIRISWKSQWTRKLWIQIQIFRKSVPSKKRKPMGLEGRAAGDYPAVPCMNIPWEAQENW